jgi:hypothetical protein
VDTRPPGAQVFVDGQPSGTTPALVSNVAPGQHTVRIERDGYQAWSSSVDVRAGAQTRVTASLETAR